MPVERIKITDRQQWLELRKRDVTASAIGALWGVHPWQTIAGVWAEKTGVITSSELNQAIERGQRLEPVVADMVREKHPEWKVWKNEFYLSERSLRFGATPDYWYEKTPGDLGLLQIKTVSSQQFQEHWIDGNPPLWIALQTLSEMMLGDAKMGLVAVLVIDAWTFELHEYEIPRHAAAEARILTAIEKFWRETDRGNQPDLDPARDGALLAAMYPTHVPAKMVDLPAEALPVLERYERLNDAIKTAQAALAEDKNRLKEWIKDAEAGFIIDNEGNEWIASLKAQDRKAFPVEATSFRRMRVKKVAKNEL